MSNIVISNTHITTTGRGRVAQLGILLALAVGCGDNFGVGTDATGSPDGNAPGDASAQAPTLTSTYPASTATGIPLNAKLSVTFDMAMTPLGATAFTLAQGMTPVPGTVANGATGTTATFTPAASLVASTTYTATISPAAVSATGVALATGQSWSFTTGTTADVTAPIVNSTTPIASSINVATNTQVAATFSEPIDPLTVTSSTFTLKQGATSISGTVSYGPGTTARFSPATALAPNALFTATLTTGVKDLQGNALAATYAWSFTTGSAAAQGPAPVGLGAAGNFVILAKAAISTVPSSLVTGDIGVSPAAATFITGFSLVADPTNVYALSTQVVGRVYAANYAVPTPTNLTTAVSNMEGAYTDAASRPTPDFLELGTGNIGGMTLAPGLYKWTSAVTIPTNVTISGGPNDVWIFQTSGNLSSSAGTRVILSGGAQAKNIFWQVAGFTTFGATSHFEGILLCSTEVTLQTGATMTGRVLAQTQVVLQQATVTKPSL